MLQHVVMNLLSNAKDALAEQGGGKINISTALDKESVICSIKDNGIGMEPKILANLFIPFFTTKPPGQGTGLGLPVAHGIVTSLGGTLTAESQPHHGSKLILSLPIRKAPHKANSSMHDTTPQLYPHNILIVDDEQDVCVILKSQCEELGFQVATAPSTDDALEILRQETFEFVITDLKMPRKGGEHLITEARKIPHLNNTRYIIITGAVTAEANQGKQEHGIKFADGFLKKPFDKSLLKQMLSDLKLES